jgi:hypothetical protein
MRELFARVPFPHQTKTTCCRGHTSHQRQKKQLLAVNFRDRTRRPAGRGRSRPGSIHGRCRPAGGRPSVDSAKLRNSAAGRPGVAPLARWLDRGRPGRRCGDLLGGRRGGRAAGHGGGGGVVGGGACARCATHTARTVRFGRRGRVNDAVSVHDWAG